ncbi:helix-turn-helix transcriptional regulator [Pinirhizobacter sp.]|jgi:transcriptional regulator with XRE-family HTH domain|uniref:helix-turn-helix domain-containing protein n=1 Tax=Pinirhizobacter sp. TaxID=2950432 RepID=UPI002F4236AC
MKVTSIHRPEHAVLVGFLRDLRVEAGLTQSEVAASLGVAQTAISDIEINERRADYLLVQDLCKIYGIAMSDFVAEFARRLRVGAKGKRRTVVRKDSRSK